MDWMSESYYSLQLLIVLSTSVCFSIFLFFAPISSNADRSIPLSEQNAIMFTIAI